MKKWTWFGLAILLYMFVLFFGYLVGEDMQRQSCKSGHPFVFDNKVFRCVEHKFMQQKA